MATEHDPFRDLSPLEQRQVNTICDRFEEAQQQGRAPRLEEFLADTVGPVRAVLLRELLMLEREYAGRRENDEECLETVGPFRLLNLVGHGAFGSVFRAIDTRDGAEVALKVPHIVTLVTPDLRQRFLGEARLAALDHPRIVKVREVGETGRVCYIASEYVAGTTLAGWLQQCNDRHEQVPFPLAARWMALLAEAIQHAHEHGVLHCDLKPANVLLREGPELEPILTDFGLARLVGDPSELTRTGQFLGTPAYMAPEQATGPRHDLGPATDVYGLGAILYEMVTGRPPFQGTNPLDILDQKRHGEPVSPRVLSPRLPRDLETICLKCLQKEPRRRYARAADLADDLRRFLAGQRIKARPIGLAERCWRWARRRPGLAALIFVGLVSAGAAVLLGLRELAAAREAVAALKREQVAHEGAELARQQAEDSFTDALQIMAELVQFGQNSEVPGVLRESLVTPWSSLKISSERPSVRRERLINALTTAETHCRRLLRQRDQDRQARQSLAEVRLYLGQLRVACGHLEQGRAALQEAQGLFLGLTREDPTNPTFQVMLAHAHRWLGHPYERTSDALQALADLRRAHELWRKLVQERPTFALRRDLAGAQHDLFRWLILHGQFQEADQLLADHRVLVEQLAQEAPADFVLQLYLVAAYLNIANQHTRYQRENEAAHWYQRTSDSYQKAVAGRPGLVRFRFHLATYGAQPSTMDRAAPFAQETRRALDQIGDDLAGAVGDDPAFPPIREELAKYCQLITRSEDWTRDPARLLERCQWCVQAYERLAKESAGDVDLDRQLLGWLIRLEVLQKDYGQAEAALATAGRVTQLLAGQGATGLSQRDAHDLRGTYLWQLAHEVRRAGKPAEALRLAEESNEVLRRLVAEAPEDLEHGVGLYRSWEEIGRAHVALGRPDEALAAWLHGVEVMRRVVERAPADVKLRSILAGRYLALSRHLRGEGRLADAAGWLREKEKLLPEDADNLRELSREFRQLAAAVSAGRSYLAPAEQAQRDDYLKQARRLERAAPSTTTAPPSAGGDDHPAGDRGSR